MSLRHETIDTTIKYINPDQDFADPPGERLGLVIRRRQGGKRRSCDAGQGDAWRGAGGPRYLSAPGRAALAHLAVQESLVLEPREKERRMHARTA